VVSKQAATGRFFGSSGELCVGMVGAYDSAGMVGSAVVIGGLLVWQLSKKSTWLQMV
jgi:hypothetical protein